ncbi:MAG: class I SAM-dependent methyltransferase [Clostridia bacterium]|nr:class I SAM-dependent methyltransferase [Clostridia bacterium]
MYNDFAYSYDTLMQDVDYKKRTDYICSLFKAFDRMPTLMLDLACGTGEFSNRFAECGVSVIGVDMSYDMLSVAREKSAEQGNDILYLCQDAAELDLYGTVDGAICCLDSLNHITDYGKFCEAIARVSLFLEKDRLFIFDLNTPYKHREILGNNTFVIDTEDVYCVWQNEYSDTNNTVEINLDFFTLDGDTYYRTSESFCERAYTDSEIENALENAGLKIEAVYEEMTQNSPTDTTQRVVYVTRKVN